MKWRPLSLLIYLGFYLQLTGCDPHRNDVVEIFGLQCEYLNEPLGIGTSTPRLSWKLRSEDMGVEQKAYRILVSDDMALLDKNKGNFWDTGKVPSGISTPIIYNGKSFRSRDRKSVV